VAFITVLREHRADLGFEKPDGLGIGVQALGARRNCDQDEQTGFLTGHVAFHTGTSRVAFHKV
jgi:hypothetical protein